MAKINVSMVHGLKSAYILSGDAFKIMKKLSDTFPEYTFSIDLDKCEDNKLVYKATLNPKDSYFKLDREKPYTRTETKKPPT